VLIDPYNETNKELPILERVQKTSLELAAQIKARREPIANITKLNNLIWEEREAIMYELVNLHPE